MRNVLINGAILLAFLSPAFADTTVTITETNTECHVSPPEEVASPVKPSAAAGTAAARDHNYALARANLKPLAESGDLEGERLYGLLLMQKCTGIQDKTAAASWLGKAADGGDVVAKAELGNAYMNGNGVAQDDAKAFALIQAAAAAGNPGAEVNLGYFYLSGRGVEKDRYQGMVWTVKAAEQGFPAALFNIAHAYFRGEALPQDNDKAARYMVAGMMRSTPAQKSRFAADINNISRAVSTDDLKHAADRAKRWSPGPGSLSDVLDDAGRQRDRQARLP
jgi:TPR repeat protein